MTSDLTLNLEHICGHFQLHDLSTKSSHDRDDFAAWLSSKECTECWKKTLPLPDHVKKGRDDKAKRIIVWELRCDMPRLFGTEKQVSWASTIRFDLLEEAYTNRHNMSEAEFIARFEEPAKRFLDAKFWIDNRDVEVDEFEAMLRNNSVVQAS